LKGILNQSNFLFCFSSISLSLSFRLSIQIQFNLLNKFSVYSYISKEENFSVQKSPFTGLHHMAFIKRKASVNWTQSDFSHIKGELTSVSWTQPVKNGDNIEQRRFYSNCGRFLTLTLKCGKIYRSQENVNFLHVLFI
jgi:hypothetical protein